MLKWNVILGFAAAVAMATSSRGGAVLAQESPAVSSESPIVEPTDAPVAAVDPVEDPPAVMDPVVETDASQVEDPVAAEEPADDDSATADPIGDDLFEDPADEDLGEPADELDGTSDSSFDSFGDFEAATASGSGAPEPSTPASTAIAGQDTLVPAQGGCGGIGFDYTTYMSSAPPNGAATFLNCVEGYKCLRISPGAYRCKQWPSPEPVRFYGQCGGDNYDGQTMCTAGSYCKYVSTSFSQCLPEK